MTKTTIPTFTPDILCEETCPAYEAILGTVEIAAALPLALLKEPSQTSEIETAAKAASSAVNALKVILWNHRFIDAPLSKRTCDALKAAEDVMEKAAHRLEQIHTLDWSREHQLFWVDQHSKRAAEELHDAAARCDVLRTSDILTGWCAMRLVRPNWSGLVRVPLLDRRADPDGQVVTVDIPVVREDGVVRQNMHLALNGPRPFEGPTVAMWRMSDGSTEIYGQLLNSLGVPPTSAPAPSVAA